MAAKEVEDLKNTGNRYIVSKPPQYEKAVEAYTKALSIDPTHHAVLSNRSLAYYKLEQYESALLDAERAISANPSWAKGYLRKCAALNMLEKHTDAQVVAEMGFKLMHSTALCRDFVSQWLKACEGLYAVEKLPSLLPPGAAELCQIMISHWMQFRATTNADLNASFLPNGLVIISEQYWVSFFHCLASHTSPSLSLTQELMSKHLNCIADEFTRILGLFGHSVGMSVKDWMSYIIGAKISAEWTTASLQESPQIIRYLKADLHETLYPLASSLLALAVTVVCTRVYTLNSASTGFESINAMLQACLVLFDFSILGTREYIGVHLKVLTGLVDSYNRRYTPINEEDCVNLIKHCKKIESLLPAYSKSCRWEYQQMVGGYEQIVATAKGLVLARQTGTAIAFQGLPDQPQRMSLSSALRDVEKHPDQVKHYAEKQFQDVIHKPRTMVSVQDGQILIQLTEIFLKLNDFDSARKALTTGEKIILSLIGVQLQQGTLLLKEAPSAIATLRQEVLMNAILLKDLDVGLVSDVMIRWKSLFSEFKTIAIMEGLGRVHFSTAKSLHSLQASDFQSSGNTTISIKEEHEKIESEFLKRQAFRCWSAVVDIPNRIPIEKILEPDELVVEFVLVGKHDEAKLRAFLEMYVLTILPSGERELVSVDFTVCNRLMKEWLCEWNAYTNKGIQCGSSEAVKKLEEAGRQLSRALFPSSVQKKIKQPVVKHVYLSLEPYSVLPLHLLPGEDGIFLFADCTVSYTNACRELLRECVTRYLAQDGSQIVHSHKPTEGEQQLKSISVSPSHPSNSTSQPQEDEAKASSEHDRSVSQSVHESTPLGSLPNCYIFANPNYDLALPEPTVSGDSSVMQQLLDLFMEKLSLSEIEKCEPLPSSQSEAEIIKEIASSSHPDLNVHMKSGNDATIDSVFELNSPLFVHFSTHGFGKLDLKVSSPTVTIWDDTHSGLALSGFNTCRAKKFAYINSMGILTPLAIHGLNLKGTRLVFLSTCVSAIGASVLLESSNSLANAFRVAGALTVIATIWNIPDESAVELVRYFYIKVFQPGVRPSEALETARNELCKDPNYSYLQNWAGFVCFGDDLPLFPTS